MTGDEIARRVIQVAGIGNEALLWTECDMLAEVGVVERDVEAALDAWGSAYRVQDDWAFMRTVMWRRAAERRLDRQGGG